MNESEVLACASLRRELLPQIVCLFFSFCIHFHPFSGFHCTRSSCDVPWCAFEERRMNASKQQMRPESRNDCEWTRYKIQWETVFRVLFFPMHFRRLRKIQPSARKMFEAYCDQEPMNPFQMEWNTNYSNACLVADVCLFGEGNSFFWFFFSFFVCLFEWMICAVEITCTLNQTNQPMNLFALCETTTTSMRIPFDWSREYAWQKIDANMKPTNGVHFIPSQAGSFSAWSIWRHLCGRTWIEGIELTILIVFSDSADMRKFKYEQSKASKTD